MKSKRLKKVVAAIATFSLMSTYLLGDYSAVAYATQKDNEIDMSKVYDITDKKVESLSTVIDSNANETLEKMYSAKDKVDIIIELESKSILQHYTDGDMDLTISSYIQSNEAQRISRNINTESDKVVNNIKKSVSDDIEVKNNYNIVLNGMTVQANFEDLEKIKNIDGVKNAFVATIHDLPPQQEVDNDTKMISSGDYVGALEANESGYTGKDTVIAVIDSGLDLDHIAFQTIPESVKMSEEDVEAVIENSDLNASGNLYKSGKIPFAYDYAEGDDDTEDYNGHGTHVSGSVAANSEFVKGIAPDAQIVAMKVFGDAGGGASDATILLALEDAISLGVDGINMSLGSGAGFTEEANEVLNGAYDRIGEAGITLIVSAGNDTTSSVNSSKGNLPLVSNPDNGMVGSPSTFEAATSVASVNNIAAYSPYILVGEDKVKYTDSNVGTDVEFSKLVGAHEYVVVPGVGSISDFEQVDVEDKIALVQRGQIAFTEKETNAQTYGAKAIVIYDNVDGEALNMQTAGLIPAIAITKADGQKLVNAEEKVINVDEVFMESFTDSTSGLMSDFSSWGVTPDLKLKPEITAPGGSIYSAIPNDGYGLKSGTSMSSPQVAGAVAVVRQYLNENNLNLTNFEKDSLILNLLMSTSSIITDSAGVAYSPRNQGSGLMNVNDAINSGAYLSVNDGKPKGELGDSTEGQYKFTFTVNNFSNKKLSYTVDTTALTENIVSNGTDTFFTQTSRDLDNTEVEFTFDGTTENKVILEAGESKDITVSIDLTEKLKEQLEVCVNGTFIDGFVTLVADNEEEVNLNIPFMGFYGDWGAAPVLDGNIYDGNGAIMYQTALGNFDMMTGSGYYLGANRFSEEWIIDENKIAIGSNITGLYGVSALVGLLRSASDVTYSVTDQNGNTVYENNTGQQTKSYYYANGGFITYALDSTGWDGVNLDTLTPYEDGVYNYKIQAQGVEDDEVEEIVFPITIDTEAPEFVSKETVTVDDKDYLQLTVKDNHYLQAAQLTDALGEPLTEIISLDYDEKGSEQVLLFEEDGLEDIETVKLLLVDYAENIVLTDEIEVRDEVVPVFKQHLKIAVEEAEKVSEEELLNVVPAVVETFKNTLENAKNVLENEDSTQVEIDKAFEDLSEAMKMLSFYKGDKTHLTNLVDRINGLDSEEYIDESWSDLEVVLADSVDVLNNENALEDEVAKSYTELLKAFLNLRLKPSKEKLEELINKAENLNKEDYTTESWDNLESTLNLVKEVYNDDDATASEVENAVDNLEKSLARLEKVADNNIDDSEEDNTGDNSTTEDDDKDTSNDNTGEDKNDESLPQTGLPGVGLAIALGLTSIGTGITVIKKRDK